MIVSTTTLRNNLAETIKQLTSDKDYFLIAHRGKKVTSALVNIDFFEDLLAKASPSYRKDIQKARKEYENGDFLLHDEVFGDL